LIPGSSSRMRSMAASSKLITDSRPLSRTACPRTAATTASAAARALISITIPVPSGNHASTSGRVGTVSPRSAYGNPESSGRVKVAPASASRTWSIVRSATRPVRSVVRSRVSSWITASWPSAVRWTSSSIASAPTSTASRKASMVFSGALAAAPR
jgi:hypothetical protein